MLALLKNIFVFYYVSDLTPQQIKWPDNERINGYSNQNMWNGTSSNRKTLQGGYISRKKRIEMGLSLSANKHTKDGVNRVRFAGFEKMWLYLKLTQVKDYLVTSKGFLFQFIGYLTNGYPDRIFKDFRKENPVSFWMWKKRK